MHNKQLIIILPIFSFLFLQNAYAHNDKSGSNKSNIEVREAEIKVVEEQKDRENWDDFMKAIKSQETKSDDKNINIKSTTSPN